MRTPFFFIGVALLSIPPTAGYAQETTSKPHNVVLFVADGLRYRTVDDLTAPTMAAIAREGGQSE